MAAIGPSLEAQALDRGWNVFTWTERGCQFMPGLDSVNLGSKERIEECSAEVQDARLAWLEEEGPGVVVIAGRLTAFVEQQMFDNQEGGIEQLRSRTFAKPGSVDFSKETVTEVVSEALQKAIDRLAKEGNSIVIVYPVPEVGWNVPSELTKRVLLNGYRWPVDSLTTAQEIYESRNKTSIQILDSLESESIMRVYPARIFCGTTIPGRCITHSLSQIYYRDDDHLSKAGADLVADDILRRLEEVDEKGDE